MRRTVYLCSVILVLGITLLLWYYNFSTTYSIFYGTPIQKANTRKYTGITSVNVRERLNASLLPSHSNDSVLYPDPLNPWDNRIITQLSYVPKVPPNITKTIYFPFMSHRPGVPLIWSEERFRMTGCKVTWCIVTNNVSHAFAADLFVLPEPKNTRMWNIVKASLAMVEPERRPDQIWAAYQDESAFQSHKQYGKREFNWTITYSPWSTVPMLYGEIYPIKPGVTTLPQTRNYAANKTAKVVWFVSNCWAANRRLEYALELSKYIDVDIYGGCTKKSGKNLTLPCTETGYMKQCMREVISRYKFYLAFENSNCNTYVTEKYTNTSLGLDIVGITMGGIPSYYTRISPPHSYIHVEDYESPAALARYLHTLDRNDTLYNEYFRWKGAWKSLKYNELDNGMMCRLCAMIHAPRRTVINTYKTWFASEHCRGPVFNTTVKQ